jgi:hypothetical protein
VVVDLMQGDRRKQSDDGVRLIDMMPRAAARAADGRPEGIKALEVKFDSADTAWPPPPEPRRPR